MTARGRTVTTAVVAISGTVAAAVLVAGGGDPGVATAPVSSGPFAHVVVADGTLEAAEATPIAVPAELRSAMEIAWIVDDATPVAAGDPVVGFDPSQLERQRLDLAARRSAADLRIEGARATSSARLDNLGTDVDVARLRSETAERFVGKDAELFSRREIVESEIDRDLAAQRERHARTSLDIGSEQDAADRELLEIQRRRVETELERVEAGLGTTEIVAPHEGVVVLEAQMRTGELPRVGQTVFSGMKLAEIPRLDVLDAEVHVLEADAGDLALGQPATVRIAGLPGREFPGTVSRVDAVPRPIVEASPVQYLAVTIELERTEPALMKPGQRVRAEIVIGRLDEALTVPRQAVFSLGGDAVVFRAGPRGFAPVPVEIGLVGPGTVVVTDGLERSDAVALAQPPGLELEGVEPWRPEPSPAVDDGSATDGRRGRAAP